MPLILTADASAIYWQNVEV